MQEIEDLFENEAKKSKEPLCFLNALFYIENRL
jgi:hypothetical protein